MKTFREFLSEESEPKVSVGQKVLVHYKKMNGDVVERGEHTVTKVLKNHFEIDRPDSETGKPMKFKHNGYGHDFEKAKSGRVKGVSKTYGHIIKSLQD